MSILGDLQKEIAAMSDEELEEIVNGHRAARRAISKPKPKKKKSRTPPPRPKTTEEITAELQGLLATMTPAQKKRLMGGE